jgi:hypothetical protein
MLQFRIYSSWYRTVLRIRIRDPGSGAFLTPGSGIRDEQPGSYFRELRNKFLGLKYLNSFIRIRDTGWKNFGSGMEKFRFGIRDNHPGSATLLSYLDHDGEADPGRLSLEGVQALILPVIAVDDGHIRRLHDQLRGRLDPHVPVEKYKFQSRP